jgi:uncharacterized membrane protein YjjP (DUF1212 family)
MNVTLTKEISDKEILIDTVSKNTEALTKLTDIISRIDNKLDDTINQYGSFDKSITELKTYMKVLVAFAGGLLASMLVGLVIFVLKQ